MSNQLEHPFSKIWGWFFGIGLVSIIGGGLALANPFTASITVTMLAAWFFLFIGAIQIVQAFGMRGKKGFWSTLFWGGLMALMALLFMLNPVAGAMSLTLMAGIIFLLIGAAKIAFALNVRPNLGWIWVLFSGLASLALAAVILIGYPANALAVLGLLFGLELLFNGTTMILLGLGLKNA